MTRPFCGLFFTAVAQSVGAGCCPAGTSSSLLRHIPAGGRLSVGIVGGFLSPCVAGGCVACAPTRRIGANAATPKNAIVIVNRFISPPFGTCIGARHYSSRASATGTPELLYHKSSKIIHLLLATNSGTSAAVRAAGICCHFIR